MMQLLLIQDGARNGRSLQANYGAIAPRSAITITLAADHRVSDGHADALFLAEIGNLLQEPDKL